MLPRTLTKELRQAVEQIPAPRRRQLRELRLRAGAPARAAYAWGEELLTLGGQPIPVTEGLLGELLDRATGFSPYALRLEEAGLFLPLEAGCRMGLCGEASVRDGRMQGLRHVSSVNIRLARQVRGIAETAADRLTAKGYPESALIVSPPGGGKTTFLRDLIRAVSEKGYRVSVADERRELSAALDGVPQLDLGPCTDVLTGCPKAQAMAQLIRVMGPQALAVDELSGPEEVAAAREAASCGVALLATAHGDGPASLLARPGLGHMLEAGMFAWVIRPGGGMERWEDLAYGKNHRGLPGGAGLSGGRLGGQAGNAAPGPAAAAAASGPGADAGGDGAPDAPGPGAV